eukprot:Skav227846  [mRNA]  locus=scaffold4698:116998:118632:- [translate_table: standard]
MEQYTGEIYVQELASMLPVEVLKAFRAPLSSLRVLDLCSAPGSKASQLALELSGVADRCLILQVPVAEGGGGAAALWVTKLLQAEEDGRHLGALAAGCFDAILLDAPCSGEGNLRRIPEATHHISRFSADDG